MSDSTKSGRLWPLLLISAALDSGALAQTTIVYYEGFDPGVLTPLTNSDSIAASFDSAATLIGRQILRTLDFESAPLGMFSTHDAASLGTPGVSLAPAEGNNGNDTSILNSSAVLEGFNTTSGGSHFLELEEAGSGEPAIGITFNFADPIVAFGAYFTGLDDTLEGAFRAVFDDGTVRNILLTENSGGGGQFWGFTTDDPSSSITSVTIIVDPEFNAGFGLFENSDVIGIDDVRWVSAIPEPSASLLLVLGLGLMWRRGPRQ